jgi:hypothetical protein
MNGALDSYFSLSSLYLCFSNGVLFYRLSGTIIGLLWGLTEPYGLSIGTVISNLVWFLTEYN